tara:strand:- start:550 stop:834 length:285 start_codon:yes stop_codon:yes gene_type:complete
MIYHLVQKEIWKNVSTEYSPTSLKDEGFIHFSTHEQVKGTYQRFYADQEMLLLEIDEKKLKAELKFEEADGMLFPHLYGSLNLDAVLSAKPYQA